MVKLAVDLPNELVEILFRIDTKNIDSSKLKSWLSVIEKNYKLFFSDRKEKPAMTEYPTLNIPADIVNILNKIDFKINPVRKGMYLAVMKQWIINNLPMQKRNLI